MRTFSYAFRIEIVPKGVVSDFPELAEVFKLQLGETGREIFGATKFLRKYRNTHKESLFQLELDSIDLRTCAANLVRFVEMQCNDLVRMSMNFFYTILEHNDEIELQFESRPFEDLREKMYQTHFP